ncbi:MAG TPA: hypothetical protein VHO90_20495 [Bacteroidales bacterium]|nr:hypothetical protein [Bacteroidales bacterium]
MKRIYFVIPKKKWGTCYLRGVQIQRALRSTGIDCRLILSKHFDRCKNGIVIFVKSCSPEMASRAIAQRNRIIWDILDGYDELIIQQMAASITLDGLITSTAASEPILSCLKPIEKALIYHHIDPRLVKKMKEKPKTDNFSLCYIGNVPSEIDGRSFAETFSEVKCVEVDTRHAKRAGWMRIAAPFRCHFAVRLDQRECTMKPLAKVGVAAACNANIIVNRSNAAVELLGADYPFLCDDSIEDALRTIERARSEFNGTIWRAGLERMSQLRERLSIEKSVEEYCSFLSRFT